MYGDTVWLKELKFMMKGRHIHIDELTTNYLCQYYLKLVCMKKILSVNLCRQWAKITTILDLTGGHAECLSADIMNGNVICEGTSTTKWARQVKPAKKH